MTEPHSPDIYIVEGITGSGKDTFCETFLQILHVDTEPVYYFPEEVVGFHYNTVLWPEITSVRLSLMEQALDFVEEESHRTPGATFVFNRFHLSLRGSVSPIPDNIDFDWRYARLVERLRPMDVQVLILELKPEEIESRLHPERAKEALTWKLFLHKTLEESAYSTLHELFAAQQEKYIQYALEQGLPFQVGPLPELLSTFRTF